jgi:hypothetical protein
MIRNEPTCLGSHGKRSVNMLQNLRMSLVKLKNSDISASQPEDYSHTTRRLSAIYTSVYIYTLTINPNISKLGF